MSSNLIEYLIAAITTIVCALLMFGLPALAIVLIKSFKLRERELILKLDAEQWTASSAEERLQSVEEAVARIEQAMHGEPALPDILDASAEGQRAAAVWTKAR